MSPNTFAAPLDTARPLHLSSFDPASLARRIAASAHRAG
jgi:hypothetical protein